MSDTDRDDLIPAVSLDESRDETNLESGKDVEGPIVFETKADFEAAVRKVLLGDLAHNEPVKEAIGEIAVRALQGHVEQYHAGNHPGTLPMAAFGTLEEIEADLEIEEA